LQIHVVSYLIQKGRAVLFFGHRCQSRV